MKSSDGARWFRTRRQYGTTEGPDAPTRFKFGPEHHVFGDEAGEQVKDIKTAWENVVLKARSVKPERTRGGRLSAGCRERLRGIDLTFHDLPHEAGSRKLDAGWPLHAVSVWLGYADVTTTTRDVNVKDDYLQELTERPPLTLVKS
jgi:integrase